MNILELKENLIDYCNTLIYPQSFEEHIKFKKVFDYKWKQEINNITITDLLTFKKPFNKIIDIEKPYFTELYKFNERHNIINSPYDSDKIFFNFDIIPNKEFIENINTLNEGDFIKIKINSFIDSIDSINKNNQNQCSSNCIVIKLKISSYEIIEKIEFEQDIKKIEQELTKKNENKEKSSLVNSFKSLNQLLDNLIEIKELQYKSKQRKSNLNSFQNEVYNKKNLEDFNLKKDIINYVTGLEFNTICEIRYISKDKIDFTIKYKNKIFFLDSKNYKKELQETIFFLKEFSSVEISFKLIKIQETINSIDIELISIKKTNKVKLFGKYIQLEVVWISIYVFLISFTLIKFSDINYFGVIPFIFKLTLWVSFGYVINKLCVKYLYKN